MRRLVGVLAVIWAMPGNASLQGDCVWAGGVWASTVWEGGIWNESCGGGGDGQRISIFLGIRI